MKGKIQTNHYQVNILVEIEGGTSKNYYAGNKQAEIEKILEEDIHKEFQKLELTFQEKKDLLAKREGFAISNTKQSELDINYNDLVKFNYL